MTINFENLRDAIRTGAANYKGCFRAIPFCVAKIEVCLANVGTDPLSLLMLTQAIVSSDKDSRLGECITKAIIAGKVFDEELLAKKTADRLMTQAHSGSGAAAVAMPVSFAQGCAVMDLITEDLAGRKKTLPADIIDVDKSIKEIKKELMDPHKKAEDLSVIHFPLEMQNIAANPFRR